MYSIVDKIHTRITARGIIVGGRGTPNGVSDGEPAWEWGPVREPVWGVRHSLKWGTKYREISLRYHFSRGPPTIMHM